MKKTIRQKLEQIVTKDLKEFGVSTEKSDVNYYKFADTYKTKKGKMRRVKYCFVRTDREIADSIISHLEKYCKRNKLKTNLEVGLCWCSGPCIAIRWPAQLDD